jgi:arabinose-5-phosphate isomerase
MSAVAVGQRVIRQEASALEQLAQSLGDTFAAVVDLIYAAEGRVILVGMGKSGHVARKIAATLASTGTPAHYVHPGEASHGDLGMIGRDDVVIALSKSGETPAPVPDRTCRHDRAGRLGARARGGLCARPAACP